MLCLFVLSSACERPAEPVKNLALQPLDQELPMGRDQSTARVLEDAKASAQTFIDGRSVDSGETYTLKGTEDVGNEILVRFQASHPDFYIYTHSVVTIAYNKNTQESRYVGR